MGWIRRLAQPLMCLLIPTVNVKAKGIEDGRCPKAHFYSFHRYLGRDKVLSSVQTKMQQLLLVVVHKYCEGTLGVVLLDI
jgi:hypothetical protein